MAKIPHSIRRPVAILKIPDAIERGLSVEGFIKELEEEGLSYRRTVMLADWRSAAGIEAKKDLFKYVRKDRIPTTRVVADVEWELSKEYMYKVKTYSRLRPDAPMVERFVNVMSDILLTPTQIEQQVYSQWGEWEDSGGKVLGELVNLRVWGAFRRVEPQTEFEL